MTLTGIKESNQLFLEDPLVSASLSQTFNFRGSS